MKMSLFGLFAMLFIEVILVLEEHKIPYWITSVYTSYDVMTWLHRLFPAFLNGPAIYLTLLLPAHHVRTLIGCRCILGAFVVDRRIVMVDKLECLHARASMVSSKSINVVHESVLDIQHQRQALANNNLTAVQTNSNTGSIGHILAAIEKRVNHNSNKDIIMEYKQLLQTVSDPSGLQGKYIAKRQSLLLLLRNIGVYILIRWLFIKPTRD